MTVFLLFPSLFLLQKERKRKWDEKNQEEIAKAVLHLDEFDQVVENSLGNLFLYDHGHRYSYFK